jgi:two-component system cell cycle sensor histidine kinase/response regulator CckA
VAYIDADGNYRFVNKSYSDYFKIPQKIDGKVNITSIFSERTYKKVKPYIDKVLEGKKVKFNDDTTLKNGEKRHFHTEYIPQFDESGKVIAYVILRQDMTGYHRMKDANFQAERYKSLSNMASGIANEYNNMLTVCLGNITLAKSVEDIPTSVYNRLLRMENAVYNAKELTQQLISFSQNADSWRDTFHLSEVLKSAITFIKKKMDSTCELNLTSETMKVQVNISQIIHVIHTIVNALVEKEPQNGTIYIVAKSKEVTTASYLPLKSGTYTTISISAKLPEFPSSGIPQIFSPFSKSENIKDSMRIATVYSIIQDHHGYLSVDHQNGSDTIFTLYIPMSKSDSHSDEIRKHVQARGDNAIVMDDEENVGRVISDMLKHLGFNVTFLKEGNSVIDTYKKALDDARSYDLVLLDLFIPNGMGAKETNQKLIEIDPNIKSIIMSGFHDDPIMLNYSDYGFAGYLKKPFEIKQLESTIATVL